MSYMYKTTVSKESRIKAKFSSYKNIKKCLKNIETKYDTNSSIFKSYSLLSKFLSTNF